MKYCAFGYVYQDRKGIILEESENYYIIKGDWFQPLAWIKTEVKLFETEEERNNWIKEQDYQYDNR